MMATLKSTAKNRNTLQPCTEVISHEMVLFPVHSHVTLPFITMYWSVMVFQYFNANAVERKIQWWKRSLFAKYVGWNNFHTLTIRCSSVLCYFSCCNGNNSTIYHRSSFKSYGEYIYGQFFYFEMISNSS